MRIYFILMAVALAVVANICHASDHHNRHDNNSSYVTVEINGDNNIVVSGHHNSVNIFLTNRGDRVPDHLPQNETIHVAWNGCRSNEHRSRLHQWSREVSAIYQH